jgi:predicted Zn-dependent protease with MMP-like domain
MKAALAALPRQYAERLDNVAFVLRRAPLPRDRRRMRYGSLYGLYEGIPLTQRDSHYGNVMPDRITIFWGSLLRDFPDEGELEDQVRKTVYHEIAHYFGLEEDDLRHTDVH